MTELALWAAGAALVAGLFWLALWAYGRMLAAQSELAISEHMADTARRMSEAEAGKPKDTSELVDRLRQGGL